MKRILYLAATLLLFSCNATETPRQTTGILYADTTDQSIIHLDIEYPASNVAITGEINRMIFCDTINAPMGILIGRYRENHPNENLILTGRFQDGRDSFISYTVTDSTNIIRTRVFSTTDGHVATLQEVVSGDLSEILEEQINAHKDDHPAVYTTGHIPLSTNFTIDGFGITFHYNAGEISSNITSITVPWSDFQ